MKWDDLLVQEGTRHWKRANQLEGEAAELRALAVSYWERAAEVREMEEDTHEG